MPVLCAPPEVEASTVGHRVSTVGHRAESFVSPVTAEPMGAVSANGMPSSSLPFAQGTPAVASRRLHVFHDKTSAFLCFYLCFMYKAHPL